MYGLSLCTYAEGMTENSTEELPVSEARANLSEVINRVRLLRTTVYLTQHGKRRAKLVPLDEDEEPGS